jgi:hypothetical protein
MNTIGRIMPDVVTQLARRNPGRVQTLHYLNLRLVEINARKTFHQDPTTENLTLWCDANEAVEAAR